MKYLIVHNPIFEFATKHVFLQAVNVVVRILAKSHIDVTTTSHLLCAFARLEKRGPVVLAKILLGALACRYLIRRPRACLKDRVRFTRHFLSVGDRDAKYGTDAMKDNLYVTHFIAPAIGASFVHNTQFIFPTLGYNPRCRATEALFF